MKAFVFAALVAVAFAQPGGIVADNANMQTEENASTESSETNVVDVVDPVPEPEVDPVPEPEVDPVPEPSIATDYATDFKHNRIAKKDYVEFDWSEHNMAQFNFADLMDLLNSDETTAALATEVKDSFKSYYEGQVANLPEVCEGGRQCRKEIKDAAMLQIKLEWEQTLELIRQEIQSTLELSRNELTTSYKSAYFCKHGCECEFIESRYTEIKSAIEILDEQIRERELKISEIEGKIVGAEVPPCDFSLIRAEYEAEWDSLEEEHDAQVAALKSWEDDGFEMQDLVDQEAFEAKYGFKYDSSRFDTWYAGEEVVLV